MAGNIAIIKKKKVFKENNINISQEGTWCNTIANLMPQTCFQQ